MSEISEEVFDKLYKLDEESLLTKNIDSKLILQEYKEISEDLICVFCKMYPLIPYNCNNCQNIICQKCYESKKQCPNKSTGAKICLIDKKLKKIIDKIQIYCINRAKGCCEKLFHKNYLNHINNCIFNSYKCQIKNCKFRGNKNQCYHHALYCGLEIIICYYCEEEIENYLYENISRSVEIEQLIVIIVIQKLKKKMKMNI